MVPLVQTARAEEENQSMRKTHIGLFTLSTIVACSSGQESSSHNAQRLSQADAAGGPSGMGDDGGADQPSPPCHPNPQAANDIETVASRGDIAGLPAELKNRLLRLAGRPHTVLPLQIFAEADGPSQLFKYFLVDTTGFEPNVFTTIFPGVNDHAMLTVTGGNCGLPTVGAVRLALEPKPGLPTDPNNPRAFIDIFTDISPLFVINNESGWYEGWLIHDLVVPSVAPPRDDGHAQFGALTQDDADRLAQMGSGNNVPGGTFTMDGNAVRLPSAGDTFPSRQTNVVPIQLTLGAYNGMQQSDVHSYWELNYTTNWIAPLYELPFTGGFPDDFGKAPDTFQDGEIGVLSSLIPGSGPRGIQNDRRKFGDSPFLPRDPDKFDADMGFDNQREFRMRSTPSGLANEVLLDVYARRRSFAPHVHNLQTRLFLAYAAEVARVDSDGDGVISALEGDIDTASDGFPDNTRLFIPATQYTRIAVTREINDGYLSPRFAPSQRAWVLTGMAHDVSPAIAASAGRDADDR
jgi:hypothetical protein